MPTRDDIKRFYKETALFLRLFYGKYQGKMTVKNDVVKVHERRKKFQGAGWIAAVEFGRDNNNLHCHAITYGPYIPWSQLLRAWQTITGDSRGVHIKPAKNPKKASNYILKYITKPPVTDSYARIAQYVITIKGTRRLRSGGIFYNRFKKTVKEKPACACAICNSRLIMDGTAKISDIDQAHDLYAELRAIDRETNPLLS
ncbi:MAG: hypothetical protein ACYTBJ_06760 [Planctomycetota bacterium]|jgi:hypothetical protein